MSTRQKWFLYLFAGITIFSGNCIPGWWVLSVSSSQKEQQRDKRERKFFSPDKNLCAIIVTFGKENSPSSESKIEFRTIKGVLLLSQSYISSHHDDGMRIWKAEWTSDSKFFVFNGTYSGGHQPSNVPTYFYSRRDNKIFELDGLVGIWVMKDFELIPPDSIRVVVRDRLPEGGFSDSLLRQVSLDDLMKKK
jgi:hypothetical protein